MPTGRRMEQVTSDWLRSPAKLGLGAIPAFHNVD
jgi:hypothetical protein